MPALPAGYILESMRVTETSNYSNDEARWSSLMISAQSGHEQDYRRLLSELSVVVQSYVSARFGGYDFVEDCVQEVLIAVHQARHTYDGRRPFRAWLFAIVRHKAIDAIRRGERRDLNQVSVREVPEVSVAGPECELGSGQLIEALPQTLREALTLTKLMGLSSAEAARKLSISETALKVRVHRAVGKLKKMLENETG